MKSRDEMETITISIPRKLLIKSVTERPERPGKPSPARRAADHFFHKAVIERYHELILGGDVDDTRGRGAGI